MSIASWASDVYDIGFATGGFSGMYASAALPMPMAPVLPAPPEADVRGVGISFDQERDVNGLMRVYIRRIRSESSAGQCPMLQVGQTLITVSGKNVYGLSLTTLRRIVPGPAGSTVLLGFQNDMGERFEVSLQRTTARGSRAANPIFQKQEFAEETNYEEPAPELSPPTQPYVQRAAPPAPEEEVLPGWERKKDPKGFVFWVNHVEKKISYTNPAEMVTQSKYDPYMDQAELPTTQV